MRLLADKRKPVGAKGESGDSILNRIRSRHLASPELDGSLHRLGSSSPNHQLDQDFSLIPVLSKPRGLIQSKHLPKAQGATHEQNAAKAESKFGQDLSRVPARTYSNAKDSLLQAAPTFLTSQVRGATASPESRCLNDEEKTFLEGVFFGAVDLSLVRIRRGSWLAAFSATTTGNTINLQPQDFDEKSGPFLNLSESGKLTLYHEMGHVWQYQNGGSSYALKSLRENLSYSVRTGDRNNAYKWLRAARQGLPWSEWTADQQAQMVAEYAESLERIEAGKPIERDLTSWRTLNDYEIVSIALNYMPKVWQGEGAPGRKGTRGLPIKEDSGAAQKSVLPSVSTYLDATPIEPRSTHINISAGRQELPDFVRQNALRFRLKSMGFDEMQVEKLTPKAEIKLLKDLDQDFEIVDAVSEPLGFLTDASEILELDKVSGKARNFGKVANSVGKIAPDAFKALKVVDGCITYARANSNDEKAIVLDKVVRTVGKDMVEEMLVEVAAAVLECSAAEISVPLLITKLLMETDEYHRTMIRNIDFELKEEGLSSKRRTALEQLRQVSERHLYPDRFLVNKQYYFKQGKPIR